jgi:hypothetical protein
MSRQLPSYTITVADQDITWSNVYAHLPASPFTTDPYGQLYLNYQLFTDNTMTTPIGGYQVPIVMSPGLFANLVGVVASDVNNPIAAAFFANSIQVA